jgi:hypothetical protein
MIFYLDYAFWEQAQFLLSYVLAMSTKASPTLIIIICFAFVKALGVVVVKCHIFCYLRLLDAVV